jgi:nicotinate phosphoribosyltransferase
MPPAPPLSALFTDLYELTMMQAYRREGLTGRAVFSLFVRRLPPTRRYLVAAGLETVLDYLEGLRFTAEEIAYLETLGRFSPEFLDDLGRFRFSGDVRAVPEGTPLFAGEPLLEIAAPLPEGQLVETAVMNQMHLETLLASKAARVVEAAAGRPVADFGARRMHGADAALKAARAFHIAGVTGTSNVEAAMAFGLSPIGTMAHSYIQAHRSEAAAFTAFGALYPGATLLVDTYDTIKAVETLIGLLGEGLPVPSAIRLDSGDLAALSKEARRRLDEAGHSGIGIVASGGLDEGKVAALLRDGAAIDAFGVGTSMGVSADAPSLDMVYKLCDYEGEGRIKLSPGKVGLPGELQVFRVEEAGRAQRDVIAAKDEALEGRPLMMPVMQNGKRLARPEPLDALRERCRAERALLPPGILAIEGDAAFPVEISAELRRRQAEAAARAHRGE